MSSNVELFKIVKCMGCGTNHVEVTEEFIAKLGDAAMDPYSCSDCGTYYRDFRPLRMDEDPVTYPRIILRRD